MAGRPSARWRSADVAGGSVRDAAGYQADLRAANTLLGRYFNTQDSNVAAAQAELAKLAALNAAPKLPDLTESLAAIESFHRSRQ